MWRYQAPSMRFHLSLAMPSHPRFLSVVRATVDGLSAVCGLTEEEVTGVTLAVDEALANVIRHAYKNSYDETIEFECVANDEQMEFTLLDNGESPDPARLCAESPDELALSGRGTHLIRAIMDEVSYTTVSEGNQLKLVKHLRDSKARAKES